jgi:hypothetical protein
MAENENMLAQAGLRFFGKMSVSATHEIKNTLAIIKESAGLLEDLSMMAKKGQPLSTSHINDISQRVARQVKRSDDPSQKTHDEIRHYPFFFLLIAFLNRVLIFNV